MASSLFNRIFGYQQIGDVTSEHKSALVLKNDRDRRAMIPIAVVDDEAFKPEINLRALGYNINFVGDLKSIDEVMSYNIVLCDLQGVGRYLNSRGQGAFIIDELKRNHPEKFVIAYTGGSLDDTITLKAQEVADLFMRKDADIDEWRDKLDTIIALLCDPAEVWRRQRLALVDADVSTMDILKLEDAFVRSIREGSEARYRELLSSQAIGADMRAIAQSLLASGIFKILVG